MNQLNKYDFYLIRFLRVFLRVFSCYYIFTCRGISRGFVTCYTQPLVSDYGLK